MSKHAAALCSIDECTCVTEVQSLLGAQVQSLSMTTHSQGVVRKGIKIYFGWQYLIQQSALLQMLGTQCIICGALEGLWSKASQSLLDGGEVWPLCGILQHPASFADKLLIHIAGQRARKWPWKRDCTSFLCVVSKYWKFSKSVWIWTGKGTVALDMAWQAAFHVA